MSFIYSLIANSKKLVLAEQTEVNGNFSQICRLILSKINAEGKYKIDYNQYKIQYIYQNNIIILLLSENIDDKIAFAFLEDVKFEIFENFSIEELSNTNGLHLNKGKEILKQMMIYYSNNPSKTKNEEKLFDNLKSSKSIIELSNKELNEVDNKEDILINKNDNFMDFKDNNLELLALNLQEKETDQKAKYIFFLASIILLIFLIYIIF